jgi:glyoxylase-like metal-dependent hydrolase (beta-lactamase superfamily II)
MIHTLDLHFKTDHTIAAFLVETSEGPALVESGPHSVFPMLTEGLAAHGYQPNDIRHLFLSHIHFDHAGAAWALAQNGTRVYVHPAGYKHLLAPERLYQSAKRIYGDEMESLWGKMQDIPEKQLIQVADRETITVGDQRFVAHYTPGHANHHIAWQTGQAIFTGDVAGVCIEGGPVVPPCPPPDIFLEAWRDSLARLRQVQPERLYLTHFGPVTDVEDHLNRLETALDEWAQWMKGPFEAGEDPAAITPRFQAYVAEQLRQQGLDEHGVQQYEAANPAWMSVAGLLRYWKKREDLLAAYADNG